MDNPYDSLHEATKDTECNSLEQRNPEMGPEEDSVLQVLWQLMDLKQTRQSEKYQNQFWHLCKTFLSELLEWHHQECPAGKAESKIKLFIQDNSRPQDLNVFTEGSITKDQSE